MFTNFENMLNLFEIKFTVFDTPLGAMMACATEEGICLLEFTDRRKLKTELNAYSGKHKATLVEGEHEHFTHLRRELDEYFNLKRKKITVSLVTPGTPFQRRVWNELQKIPYGTTRSYKQQAIAIGKPEAVRAVANANGMNRIAIIIPCHRVIGEDGTMTGYGGGIWRKKWLLDLETGQKTINH